VGTAVFTPVQFPSRVLKPAKLLPPKKKIREENILYSAEYNYLALLKNFGL
jgi:hypothetical protein